MREAALLTALDLLNEQRAPTDRYINRSAYLNSLDSLSYQYDDLAASCEIEIAKDRFYLNAKDYDLKHRYDFLKQNEGRWKNWLRGNYFTNELKSITNPQFHYQQNSEVILPGKETTARLTAIRNLSDIKVTITQIKADGTTSLPLYDEKEIKKVKALKIKSTAIELNKHFSHHPEYELFEDSITIPKLSLGVYLIEISTPNERVSTSYSILYVSNLQLMAEEMPGKEVRYVAVDATTGHPISEAKIQLINSWKDVNDKDNITVTTNENGEYIYKINDNGQTEYRYIPIPTTSCL